MIGSDEGVSHLHLASAAFAGREGLDAFRETICRPVLTVDIEPLDEAFELDCTLHFIPGFAASFGRMSPVRWTHATAMAGTDDVILACVVRGAATVHQQGREALLTDGSASIVADDSPGSFLAHVRSGTCHMRFDRARLRAMSVDLDAALARPIARDNAALRLLLRYAGIVRDDGAMATATLRRTVTSHLYELAALAIGASTDVTRALRVGSGVRAARLHAIKADIRSGLTNSALSVHAVALHHGVTPRYVQKLFELEGATFSEFVLVERLALACRMLRDPQRARQTISTIAYDAGFNDLSYFNRTFRIRYGMTPSDARHQARLA